MSKVIDLDVIVKKQSYRIASRLVSMEGDSAEQVVYCSLSLTHKAKESLLEGIRRRRLHLENKRGF